MSQIECGRGHLYDPKNMRPARTAIQINRLLRSRPFPVRVSR